MLNKNICFDASQNVPLGRYSILHVILKEKISFDASQNVPSGRNSTLAITALITLKQNSF